LTGLNTSAELCVLKWRRLENKSVAKHKTLRIVLASAVKLGNTFRADAEIVVTGTVSCDWKRQKKDATSVESVFGKTMSNLLAAESEADQKVFEVGPVVSSEKKYWRTDDAPVKGQLPGRVPASSVVVPRKFPHPLSKGADANAEGGYYGNALQFMCSMAPM
jgi:hypothetical protein